MELGATIANVGASARLPPQSRGRRLPSRREAAGPLRGRVPLRAPLRRAIGHAGPGLSRARFVPPRRRVWRPRPEPHAGRGDPLRFAPGAAPLPRPPRDAPPPAMLGSSARACAASVAASPQRWFARHARDRARCSQTALSRAARAATSRRCARISSSRRNASASVRSRSSARSIAVRASATSPLVHAACACSRAAAASSRRWRAAISRSSSAETRACWPPGPRTA